MSGVTKKNTELFPRTGFSITGGEILSEQEVRSHRKYLAEFLGKESDQLKFQKQVHGDKVRIVGIQSYDEESDGMACQEKAIMLNVAIADCAAILMYSLRNNVIAAVHSGWRGSKLCIVSKCIDLLRSQYDAHAEDLLIYISPCAGGDSYEVGEDVAAHFPDSIRKIPNGKYLFDNKHEILKQLIAKGVSTLNIEVAGECTIANAGLHSYRRDGKHSGRMSAFIAMV